MSKGVDPLPSRSEALQKVAEAIAKKTGKTIMARKDLVPGCAAEGRPDILPSDFCYNVRNANSHSGTEPLFIKIAKGVYEYVGRNHPYKGPIERA